MRDDMEEISLKEVLLGVSKKLDTFLEQHQTLHTEMAVHGAKVDQIVGDREEWGNELKDLREWKVEVQGQLKLIRWLSSAGAFALVSIVLKALGVPIP